MLTRRIFQPTSLTFAQRLLTSTKQRYPRIHLQHSRSRFSSQQQQQQQQQTTKKPDGKLKKFMKAYGYVGVGVYVGFSIVDLSLTMGLIRVKGADKVEQLEHWIVSKVKTSLGMSLPPPEVAQQQHHHHQKNDQHHQPSWTSIFVLAYGIHKTALLPIRLSLTAAVTPVVARKLASLGWVRRKSLPKTR